MTFSRDCDGTISKVPAAEYIPSVTWSLGVGVRPPASAADEGPAR
jgi:hypothetical protein